MRRSLVKVIPILLCFICLISCAPDGALRKKANLISKNNKSNKNIQTKKVSLEVPSIAPANIQVPDKSETIQNTEYTLKYSKTVKATGVQVHDRDVYVDNQGTEVEYDHVTGQLVGFSTNVSTGKPDQPITEEEVLQIAQEYMNRNGDFSQYSLVNILYNEYTGYKVNFTRLICGYKTTDYIAISISADGKIQWLVYNPYVFDGKQIDDVDEEDALKKLEAEVNAYYKDKLIQYEIQDKRMGLGENGVVVLQFLTKVDYYHNDEKALEKKVFTVEIE